MSESRESGRRVRVGYYGKLPTHGDFVHRAVRDEFLDSWDRWLQEAIVGSQRRLGEAWLQTYLTSPIWRFVLSSGLVGGASWAGVLMPSVDRVGRYFPLTLVGEFDPGVSPFRLAKLAEAWFAELEERALGTLDAAALDLEELAAAIGGSVARLPDPAAARNRRNGQRHAGSWEQSLVGLDDLMGGLADWVERSVPATWRAPSLWWTRGSDLVAPQWRLVDGLPDADTYATMLGDPSSAQSGRDEPEQAAGFDPASTLVRAGVHGTCWRSGGFTDVGKVRAENQDAWISRDDAGLWAVADGMGGHQDGALASRTVVSAVERIALDYAQTMQERVAAVRGALQDANRELRDGRRSSSRDVAPAGSTAVVLLCGGTEAAALWVGDSRLYRLRDGALQRLTEDHAVDDDDPANRGVITRAVGGEDALDIDERRFDLQPGDRFVLCSDGVHGSVPEAAVAGMLGSGDDATEIARRIGEVVLASGARDNLTAVVVLETARKGNRTPHATSNGACGGQP